MSFTTDIKSELCHVPVTDETALAECLGMLLFAGQFSRESLRIQCEMPAVRHRVLQLMSRYMDLWPEEADTILVFSCGVGVQTVAEMFPAKKVVACCDTYALPGFQGVTPLEHDCKQCGECYLNITGGICPITACSKSLINGQCGGAKNGKCEVDPNMDCGWERIYQKLKAIGRLDALKCPIQVRNYATDELVSKSK